MNKQKKREAKRNLREAREILNYMENLLSGDEKHVEMACAFFAMFSHHLNYGDLRPHEVHLAALLRTQANV